MIESVYIDDLQIHGDGADYQLTNLGAGLLGSPIVRENRPDKPERHGSIELSRYYGGRVIELQGIVVGDSISDAYDKLDALKLALQIGQGVPQDFEQVGVQTGTPVHQLKFTRVGDSFEQYTYVTQSGSLDVSVDVVSRILPFGVTLYASDPRYYEIADGVHSPYEEVTILHGTTETITAGGNADALPWFTLEGPFNTYGLITMTVDTDDFTDKVLYSLGDGNNIDIVTRTRLAVKNQTIMPSLIDRANTSWFGFPPGVAVDVEFTTGGGADAGTVCIARWQNARF